jgi:PIN domain nuclease of toxin-antitoxin system
MRLLLDTHTFVWFIEGSLELSTTARDLIEAADNEVLLSMASMWEMAIKGSIGKLEFSEPFETLIPEQLSLNKIDLLNIQLIHVVQVHSLPLHHRDPFDRLIVSQALVEKIPVIGRDGAFDAYGITRLW